MLTPGASQFATGDNESLQADVMRFMAIIAFCLIAILALVRNTDPAVAAPETPAAQAQPQPESPAPLTPPVLAQAAPLPQPAPREPADTELPALATSPEPAAVPEAPIAHTAPPPEDMAPEPLPPVATEDVRQAATAEQRPEQPVPDTAASDPEPGSEQATQRTSPDEAALILRFASDSDFLRLIARGEISVYAFSGTDVLQLDSGYQFATAPSPGQVYELLPGSIPSLIGEALDRARPSNGQYRWGIALPRRISARIEQYLNTVEQGQLVIDRYGDVHHVAAT